MMVPEGVGNLHLGEVGIKYLLAFLLVALRY